jgi:hypothetical protein
MIVWFVVFAPVLLAVGAPLLVRRREKGEHGAA